MGNAAYSIEPFKAVGGVKDWLAGDGYTAEMTEAIEEDDGVTWYHIKVMLQEGLGVEWTLKHRWSVIKDFHSTCVDLRKTRKKQGAKFPAIEGAKKIGKKSKKEVARKLADGKAFIAQLSTSPINAEPQVLGFFKFGDFFATLATDPALHERVRSVLDPAQAGDLDAMVGVASGDALPTFADVADGSAAKKKKEMEAESARGSDTTDRVRTAHDKASPDLDDLLAGLDDETVHAATWIPANVPSDNVARYMDFRIYFKCTECGTRIFMRGPELTHQCLSCGTRVDVPAETIAGIYKDGIESYGEIPYKSALTKQIMAGGFTFKADLGNLLPRCTNIDCKHPLDVDTIPIGRETSNLACGECGKLHRTAPAPEWLTNLIPEARQVYCTEPCVIDIRSEMKTVACPSCSHERSFERAEGGDRTYICSACNKWAFIPDCDWGVPTPLPGTDVFIRFQSSLEGTEVIDDVPDVPPPHYPSPTAEQARAEKEARTAAYTEEKERLQAALDGRGQRMVVAKMRTTCAKCAKPVYLNGPTRRLACPECGEAMVVNPEVWGYTLNEGINPSQAYAWSEAMTSTTIAGGRTFENTVGRLYPRCNDKECGKAWDVSDIAVGTFATDCACDGCGRPHSTYPAPDWLIEIMPDARQIFCAELIDDSAHGPAGALYPPSAAPPVVFPCPACSASLEVTFDDPQLKTCGACSSNVFVPFALHKHFNSAVKAAVWFILCDGSVPAAPLVTSVEVLPSAGELPPGYDNAARAEQAAAEKVTMVELATAEGMYFSAHRITYNCPVCNAMNPINGLADTPLCVGCGTPAETEPPMWLSLLGVERYRLGRGNQSMISSTRTYRTLQGCDVPCCPTDDCGMPWDLASLPDVSGGEPVEMTCPACTEVYEAQPIPSDLAPMMPDLRTVLFASSPRLKPPSAVGFVFACEHCGAGITFDDQTMRTAAKCGACDQTSATSLIWEEVKPKAKGHVWYILRAPGAYPIVEGAGAFDQLLVAGAGGAGGPGGDCSVM